MKKNIIQINPSTESGGKQPFQQNRIYDIKGGAEIPALPANMSSKTHAIMVSSATKNGYELATIGDSINYSIPKSKTRRGRVGVGVAQTLDTQVNQAVLLEGNIRRLTEIECERLQGFPDNWTMYGNYDGVVKKVSSTQRYKLIGNAVTVDIVKMIGDKLVDDTGIVLVSLFSGIDGFAKGLIRAGFNITNHYFSEIDNHAIANIKYNFPNAEHIGSVLNVSGTAIRSKHPNAKIIVTFGWPCQDNSIAGKRKGQRVGTRSGLLFEAGRIVDELRPQHFIAENVKGLFSVNEGKDFYEAIRFLTYLNSDSPQYTVEMQLLNTNWLLPQNRERTYFLGHLGTGRIKKVFPITENDSMASERPGDPTSVRTLTGGGIQAGCTQV